MDSLAHFCFSPTIECLLGKVWKKKKKKLVYLNSNLSPKQDLEQNPRIQSGFFYELGYATDTVISFPDRCRTGL